MQVRASEAFKPVPNHSGSSLAGSRAKALAEGGGVSYGCALKGEKSKMFYLRFFVKFREVGA